ETARYDSAIIEVGKSAFSLSQEIAIARIRPSPKQREKETPQKITKITARRCRNQRDRNS
ncbi:MAG TPA: hypothetical protein VHY59_02070, partial [Chthoniobacterales bacterium]|nr:hypothetical protein [Chthoniobacterales bacterium]